MTSIRIRSITPRQTLNFQMLGYRDYVAARKLLIDDYLMQGATLASTSIEKYLKCVLGVKGVRANIHLDDVGRFKKVLEQHGITAISEMDPAFVEIISKAYLLRYYDGIEKMHFGFHKWQLLGMLDHVVSVLERRITRRLDSGEIKKSEYQLAVDRGDPEVCFENHVVSGKPMQEFMERPGDIIIILVDEQKGEAPILMKNTATKYSGKMFTVTKEGDPFKF